MTTTKQEDYQNAIGACVTAARIITLYDLPDLLASIATADALGPVLDPTLWIQNNRKMEEDRKIIEAALPLWKLAKTLEERAKDTKL